MKSYLGTTKSPLRTISLYSCRGPSMLVLTCFFGIAKLLTCYLAVFVTLNVFQHLRFHIGGPCLGSVQFRP